MKTSQLTLIIIAVLVIGLGIGLGLGFLWNKPLNDNTNADEVIEVNLNTSINTNTVANINTASSDYCGADDDCITAGCNGGICMRQGGSVPGISACVAREWHKCLAKTSCGCINNQCQWEKNEEYTSCLAEYK